MTLAQFFFMYLAVAMTVCSVLVITQRNPMHSVVLMLILFVHIAVVYLFLNADFIAAVQIIVYAGAILVLFLFVIMLLNLRQEALKNLFQRQWLFGLSAALTFVVFLGLILSGFRVFPSLGKYSIEAIKSEGIMMTTGKVLYTEYLLPFEIASLILLIAILGAVVLTKKQLS